MVEKSYVLFPIDKSNFTGMKKNAIINNNFITFIHIYDILVIKSKDTPAIYRFEYYPDSLNLKKALDDYKRVNYLDVSIAIEGNKMMTYIYDKRIL